MGGMRRADLQSPLIARRRDWTAGANNSKVRLGSGYSALCQISGKRRSRGAMFRHTLGRRVCYAPSVGENMSGGRIERRLAAILAADVVGYSRLMGTDEEGTLTRLKSLRNELIDPGIAEHKGRIVKTTGDGLLVEFGSVVDAVQCAVEVQAAMAERNAEVPSEQRIELRIGINLGDIIIDEGDIFGDGVNIAARLEALAVPGGICVNR
jgi:class 3 adenylate cyclase